MKTHWHWVPFNENELSLGEAIAQRLQLPPVVGAILTHRGVTSVEEAERFLYPRLSSLHDPFLIQDMHKAVERLNKAVGRKEKILIYGDYDVDGTTAVALVYKMLRLYGVSPQQLLYYIPDRNDDGYGVSMQGIEFAKEQGVNLVIALDCGIKAVAEIAYAKEQGIDFLICDHHTPDNVLPDAVAVLDPKRADNSYPFTELAGCGIGFKLMQAFAINNRLPQSRLREVLELCAISIAADLVSVLGENRTLAFFGLKQLNKNPSPALKGIIKSCKIPVGKRIDMSDIVFKIAPLLNASGRMLNGMQTVALLLAADESASEERCRAVIASNERRKKVDRITTNEAIAMVSELRIDEEEKIITLYKPTWHKGVIGIVASRLCERYARPVIILAGEGDNISGSARSGDSFDLYKAIDQHRHLLVNFGGHPYAAGLTIKKENLPLFFQEIREYARREIEQRTFTPKLEVTARLKLTEISWRLYNSIERLAPFGPDNPRPLFVSYPLYDGGGTRVVGRNLDHLSIDATDAPNRRYPFLNTIAFGMASDEQLVRGGEPYALCYSLEETNYMNTHRLQLLVKDIHPAKGL